MVFSTCCLISLFPSITNAKESEQPADVIVTPPEGRTVDYSSNSLSYYSSWGEIRRINSDFGAKQIVFTDDNEVFLLNPFTFFNTDTYIKGDLKDDKIIFDFPQHLIDDYTFWPDVDPFEYYVYRMIPNKKGGYKIDPDCQSVVFTIGSDGIITQESGCILGICDNKIWEGVGEEDMVLTPFTEKVGSFPENSCIERYAFFNNNGGRFIEGCVDGNTMYLGGIFEDNPEAVVKGTIDGGKVTFESGQYLGVYSVYYIFAYGAEVSSPESVETKNAMVFDYDPNTLTLTASSNDIWIENAGKDQEFGLLLYAYMTIRPQDIPAQATPVKPESIDWQDQSSFGIHSGILRFFLYPLSTDNEVLPYDNLFFRVYVNDEVYTFSPDDYPGIISETDLVPASFSDEDHFYAFPFSYSNVVFMEEYKLDNIGVQAIYKNIDGTYTPSEISWWGDTDVIDVEIDTQADKFSEEWFDLQGNKIAMPTNGIYIHVVRYTNGECVREKKIVR